MAISDALLKLRPESQFVIYGEDYSTIIWHKLDGDAPTETEVKAAIIQVKADKAEAELSKAAEKQALLDRLGITADEAKLIGS